jgi:hypothetical protein
LARRIPRLGFVKQVTVNKASSWQWIRFQPVDAVETVETAETADTGWISIVCKVSPVDSVTRYGIRFDKLYPKIVFRQASESEHSPFMSVDSIPSI